MTFLNRFNFSTRRVHWWTIFNSWGFNLRKCLNQWEAISLNRMQQVFWTSYNRRWTCVWTSWLLSLLRGESFVNKNFVLLILEDISSCLHYFYTKGMGFKGRLLHVGNSYHHYSIFIIKNILKTLTNGQILRWRFLLWNKGFIAKQNISAA